MGEIPISRAYSVPFLRPQTVPYNGVVARWSPTRTRHWRARTRPSAPWTSRLWPSLETRPQEGNFEARPSQDPCPRTSHWRLSVYAETDQSALTADPPSPPRGA
jgi:hypothetical protein